MAEGGIVLGRQGNTIPSTPSHTVKEVWLVRIQILTVKTIHKLTRVTKRIY